jgi:hypothetical protein
VSQTTRHYRGRVAALTRSRAGNDPELVDAKLKLRETRLAEYIQQTVDEAPPLTEEQRTRLSLLLRGGDAA